MKTLELKYIVGYLPFGLEVKWKDEILGLCSLRSNNYCKMIDCYDVVYGSHLKHIKPLLLPLSMLNKEFDYGSELGGKRILMEDHTSFMKLTTEGKELSTLSDLFIYYGNITNLLDIKKIIDELYRFHIDIHGLIEKGFAIDKTTLK